jgi:hypothetical protein
LATSLTTHVKLTLPSGGEHVADAIRCLVLRAGQNAYVESFSARIRDELLDVEQFSRLAEGAGRDH